MLRWIGASVSEEELSQGRGYKGAPQKTGSAFGVTVISNDMRMCEK